MLHIAISHRQSTVSSASLPQLDIALFQILNSVKCEMIRRNDYDHYKRKRLLTSQEQANYTLTKNNDFFCMAKKTGPGPHRTEIRKQEV